MTDWFKDLSTKAKVLVKAWPTWAAAITAVLTAVAVQAIPLLPDDVAVQAAAWIAYGLGVVTAISAAVARVTPILFPEEKGILPQPARPVEVA